MSSTVKWRLAALLVAIAALASLIAWALITSSDRLKQTRTQARTAAAESFGLTRDFQSALIQLNGHLLKLASTHDAREWTAFEQRWTSLNDWIDEQHLTSPPERQLLDEINSVFDEYHSAAENLRRQVQAGETSSEIREFAELQRQLARLVDLASRLGEAHREVLRGALTQSNEALAHLHMLLLGALALLLMFGGWLAFVVYRQLIAPLHIRLVESEALLQRQEKLASLGVLAAGVAHEIRNPLTAIKAWLFMHQRKLQPATQDFTDAQVVANELNRLERIVKDFLRFARPSQPEFQTIPSDQPLREVGELLGSQLAQSKITLCIAKAPPANIRVDPEQIKQVLINLVQNSADAIGSDGTITLSARPDRMALGGPERDVVVIEVADTGKGIPPEVESRLFDPFFTTKESGAGLGLSISARLIHEHGGALHYRTRLNHGTTFGVVLPRAT